MPAPDQKYRIIDKLDSGGMAEIYRAEAEMIQGMKKKVAIKRILPHLTKNEKFVAMFLDEARLSLYLNHANIVHVSDIGRSGNTYFIVMEYVEGINLRSLNDWLRRRNRPLRMELAIYIVMEALKGLGYAHDMVSPDDGRDLNIVHRDVSPPNILISRNGEVKLVDFGLAKAASQAELTDPGVVKGKFSYLSPEAASGQDVTFSADIFAAGIILFELLTGRRLFYGETDYQTVELVRKAHVPHLAALNPSIPDDLDQIVRRALARDPGQRYDHAHDFQDALAQFLFARGLKVTSRDIASIVRRCLAQKEEKPDVRTRGVIDTLINDEIQRFTSLDDADYEAVGGEPLSPEEIGGSGPLDPRDFIDTRGWSNELGTTSTKTRRPDPFDLEVTSLESVLEGEEEESDGISPATPAQPKPRRWRGVLIALVVVIVLGATTVFLLHTLGLLGNKPSGDNRDIIQPK